MGDQSEKVLLREESWGGSRFFLESASSLPSCDRTLKTASAQEHVLRTRQQPGAHERTCRSQQSQSNSALTHADLWQGPFPPNFLTCRIQELDHRGASLMAGEGDHL